MREPTVEIAVNDHYKFEELKSIVKILDSTFKVKIKRYEEFQESDVGPIIIFILSAISSGFLQAIGKEVWNKFKETIAPLVANKDKNGISDLEFQVRNGEKEVRFFVRSDDSNILEKAIEKFPEALEVAEKEEYETGYYEYDKKKQKWVT